MLITRIAAPIVAICMIAAMFFGLFSCESCSISPVSDADVSVTDVVASEDTAEIDQQTLADAESVADGAAAASPSDVVGLSSSDVHLSGAFGSSSVSSADIIAQADANSQVTAQTAESSTAAETTATTTEAVAESATTTEVDTQPTTTTESAIPNGVVASFDEFPALCILNGETFGETGILLLLGERLQRGTLSLVVSSTARENHALVLNNCASNAEIREISENYPTANVIYTYRQNRAFFVKLEDDAKCAVYNHDGVVYLDPALSRPDWLDESIDTVSLNAADIEKLAEKLAISKRCNTKPFLVVATANDVFRYFPGI